MMDIRMEDLDECSDPLTLDEFWDLSVSHSFFDNSRHWPIVVNRHPVQSMTIMGFDYYKCVVCGLGIHMYKENGISLEYYFGELLDSRCSSNE